MFFINSNSSSSTSKYKMIQFLRWIVSQVQEQAYILHRAILLEILLEKSSSFHVDTHSSEDNSEIVAAIVHNVLAAMMLLDQAGLTTNLSCDFIVWQTGSRENGNLLTTSNTVHHIDRRNTSLDHFFGVFSRKRVDRLTLDVQKVLG